MRPIRSEMEGSIARWNRCHRSRSPLSGWRRRRCEGDAAFAVVERAEGNTECTNGWGSCCEQHDRLAAGNHRRGLIRHHPLMPCPATAESTPRRCGSDHRLGRTEISGSGFPGADASRHSLTPVSFHDAAWSSVGGAYASRIARLGGCSAKHVAPHVPRGYCDPYRGSR